LKINQLFIEKISISILKSIFVVCFVFLSILIFENCKTTKKTTTTPTPVAETPKANSVSEVLSILEKNEIKANWLSSEVDVDYEGKPQNISGSMSVRYRRDSLIWLTIKKFGFAGARAKITKDSVFLVNYLQSSYIAENLKYLETKYGLPADFSVVQNILLGNPIFLTDKSKLKMERDVATNDIILRGADDKWQTTYHLDPTDFSLKSMLFEQPNAQRSLKIECEKYEILRGYDNDTKKLAHFRRLILDSPQSGKVKVELDISDDIEVNIPKTIKFEIPSHYEKMD
jgi:Domain of unknown function (DUF4292)